MENNKEKSLQLIRGKTLEELTEIIDLGNYLRRVGNGDQVEMYEEMAKTHTGRLELEKSVMSSPRAYATLEGVLDLTYLEIFGEGLRELKSEMGHSETFIFGTPRNYFRAIDTALEQAGVTQETIKVACNIDNKFERIETLYTLIKPSLTFLLPTYTVGDFES